MLVILCFILVYLLTAGSELITVLNIILPDDNLMVAVVNMPQVEFQKKSVRWMETVTNLSGQLKVNYESSLETATGTY